MKMSKKLSVGCVVVSIVLVIAGCQPKTAKAKEQAIEPVPSKAAEAKEVQMQPEVTKEATPQEGGPKIVLTKATHDFGEVGPSTVHKAEYEFVNQGDAVLLVNNVQTTCGCSKPTLIKEDKRYPAPLKEPVSFEPGESGKVEVTYTAGSAKGSVTKHLYILSNDPATQRAQLELKANIDVKVAIEPEKVDLRLDQENAGMPELVLKSKDNQAFSIKSVTVANQVITVPFDPKEKATEFILNPQVDMQKLEKFNTGVIQISTDHPQGGKIMVRFDAKPMYELTNPRYILQNVKPGEPIIRENLIRSNYGKVAEIESVSSRNGYMEIESQEQDGNHIKLKVKITPPAQNPAERRVITDELTITLKDGHQLSIRCNGWFRMK